MGGQQENNRAEALGEAKAAFEAGYAAFYRSLSVDERRAVIEIPDGVWDTIEATGLDSVADTAMPAATRALLARLIDTVAPLKKVARSLMTPSERAAELRELQRPRGG